MENNNTSNTEMRDAEAELEELLKSITEDEGLQDFMEATEFDEIDDEDTEIDEEDVSYEDVDKLLSDDAALQIALKNVEEFKAKWTRSVAEFENYKKRTQEATKMSYLEGRYDVILKFLPIGENLERALETAVDEQTRKGIEMVIRAFKQLLVAEGLEEINPIGQEFDVHTSEAIMSVPPEEGEPEGIVKQVYAKGYRKGDKIIRYAQVVVTK